MPATTVSFALPSFVLTRPECVVTVFLLLPPFLFPDLSVCVCIFRHKERAAVRYSLLPLFRRAGFPAAKMEDVRSKSPTVKLHGACVTPEQRLRAALKNPTMKDPSALLPSNAVFPGSSPDAALLSRSGSPSQLLASSRRSKSADRNPQKRLAHLEDLLLQEKEARLEESRKRREAEGELKSMMQVIMQTVGRSPSPGSPAIRPGSSASLQNSSRMQSSFDSAAASAAFPVLSSSLSLLPGHGQSYMPRPRIHQYSPESSANAMLLRASAGSPGPQPLSTRSVRTRFYRDYAGRLIFTDKYLDPYEPDI